jgi:hypothetical protein
MCQQKQQLQMIRDILLIFWRFHRIGFPSRYEAHAILAMLAVSVWHFCLVLAAAAACSGSCEDGETSLVQVGSWPVESLKYPKNEKRVRRSMKVMGFSFFSEFGNEMKMTRCEIQGANRHDLIFWCNSCHCPKQADQHSILSEKIWNDADHCAIYVCVCIYIYIQRTHTHRHTFVSVPNWEGGRHQEKLSILLSYVSQQENDQPFVDETWIAWQHWWSIS